MCYLPRSHDAAQGASRRGSYHRVASTRIGKRARDVVHGDRAETAVVFGQVQHSKLGTANPYGVLQHGVEHRLQLASRAGDNLENLRGRRLLLQRLREIVRALAQLVEQSRVLDGDHSLRGKVLHQFDLFVGERAHLRTIHVDRADKLALFKHRHHHKSPRSRVFYEGNDAGVLPDVRWIDPQIGNMDKLFGLGHTIERDSRVVAQVHYRITPPKIDVAFFAVDRDSAED